MEEPQGRPRGTRPPSFCLRFPWPALAPAAKRPRAVRPQEVTLHAPSQLQQLGGGGERDMHRILKNQKERKEVTPVEPSWPQLIPADPN